MAPLASHSCLNHWSRGRSIRARVLALPTNRLVRRFDGLRPYRDRRRSCFRSFLERALTELSQRDERGDGRERAEGEGVVRRERESAVYGRDDLWDQRLELRPRLGRRAREDSLAKVADCRQAIERRGPRRCEAGRDLRRHTRRGKLPRDLHQETRREYRPGDREADTAADLLEEGQAARRSAD